MRGTTPAIRRPTPTPEAGSSWATSTAASCVGPLRTATAETQTPPRGPVGIWAYQANNIVFEHNLSWGNRTSGADGGGFDFDHGVTNSVMQYNLSHDNHAYGYLLYTNDSPTTNLHNVLRYNVSYDDSASGTPFYGAVTLLGGLSGPHTPGGLRGVSVYNNTVIASAGVTGLPSLLLLGGTLEGVLVANNAFIAASANPLITSIDAQPGDIRFLGNSYATPDGQFTLDWGPNHYSGLADSQNATGNEMLNGLSTRRFPVSVPAPDIRLISTSGGSRWPLEFKPLPDGPLVGHGVSLDQFNLKRGPVDFFGSPIVPNRWDIGAAVPS